jgi:DNA-binding response OmpR family regulator
MENNNHQVTVIRSMRKALSWLKKQSPDLVFAEFNFEPTFRDRVSSLESLLATLQSKNSIPRVVVITEEQDQTHLDKLHQRFPLFSTLYFPLAHNPFLDYTGH